MSRKEPIKHRYAKALERCPMCGHYLRGMGGVVLVLSVGGQVVEVLSRLDEQGFLEDTDDCAVAEGFHSETRCGGCGESLITYEEAV